MLIHPRNAYSLQCGIELTTQGAIRRGGVHLKQLALEAPIPFCENERAVSHLVNYAQ